MSRLRVIILNYNRSALTTKCVHSVLSQDYVPLDIVVVDNHSEDKEFIALANSLPRYIQIIRSPCNLGYSGGNNIGIKYKGLPDPKYVAIVNNDIIFINPNILGNLVSTLERDSTRAACSPLVDTVATEVPPEKQVQVRRLPSYLALLVADSWWLRRLPGLRNIARLYSYDDMRPYPYDEEIECETINGSCWVVRKEIMEQIGYLDEGTFLYQEEIIFGKQIQKLGKRNCLVTSSIVHHYQGGTSGQRAGRIKIDSFRHMVQSEAHYCRKYLGISAFGIGALFFIRAIDIFTKVIIKNIQDIAAYGK